MTVNMNFYDFIHKQIIILILLTLASAPGYVFISLVYSLPLFAPSLWMLFVLLMSLYGYKLYKDYTDKNLNLQEKDEWFIKSKFFIYIYFSLWTMMFLISVYSNVIELHYIAIATQIGAAVVSAAILVSQRQLLVFTLVSLMFPLVVYFVIIGEPYSYLLAFFSFVLGGVLIYSSLNTNRYLLKSRFQSYHDYLTQLGNRYYFSELLQDAIKTQEKTQEFISLILIDLDNFKTVNDSLGHEIGDKLLAQVASRMNMFCVQENSYIARLGGDEFCILSATYKTRAECVHSAQNFSRLLLSAIKDTYYIEDHHLYISASIGISIIDNPHVDANIFLKEADIAMYEAKLQGRDGITLFNNELSQKIEKKLEIERLLHFALDKNEIYLMYQPQVDRSFKIIGCEVLVRWKNEKLGEISPTEFIPISENSGLIIELGKYIVEESFKTLKEWSESGIILEQFSINISMRQLFSFSFIQEVQELVKKYLNDNLCTKVIFEITETSVADNVEKLILIMQEVKKLGIKFSMDDFGTGYSSLSHLRRLPINELKIDKSFLVHLDDDDEQNKIMIQTILNIAKSLKLSVVAEGVESRYQQEFLVLNNCDILQGYLFSKPVLKEEFVKLL
jgi:diguanylate cyclase (GGDEF)-like protein